MSDGTSDPRDRENGRQRRSRDLAFFGMVTAGASHDLRNVLATIREHAGLIEDLLAMTGDGIPIKPERLKRIAGRVARQITRGDQIINRLNRFAHSTDHPVCKFDLGALATDLVGYMQRMVERRGHRLELKLPEGTVGVWNSPFGVQQSIVSCLRALYDLPSDGHPLVLAIDPRDRGVRIVIVGPPVKVNAGLETTLADLSDIAADVNGKIELRSPDDPEIAAIARGRNCFVIDLGGGAETGPNQREEVG